MNAARCRQGQPTWVALGVLGATLVSAGARAADARPATATGEDKNKQRATRFLRVGATLMEKKEPAAALGKFDEAYGVFPSPKIQFNIGVACEALGRPAAALRAFTAYLDGAPKDTQARRQEATTHALALRGQVGQVEIEADLPGLAVLVDGVDEGRTPLFRPLLVDPGPHSVSLEPPSGERRWTRVVRAEAGRTIKLEALLASPAGAPPVAAWRPQPPPARPAPGAIVTALPSSSGGFVAGETASAAAAAPGGPPRPLYKRAWFWGAVGAVAAAASAVILVKREHAFTCPPGTTTCLQGR